MTSTDLNKIINEELHNSVPMFDDAVEYPLDQIIELYQISEHFKECMTDAEKEENLSLFRKKKSKMNIRRHSHKKVYLWPDGVLPTLTDYTSNPDYKYNHDPDFKPYMWEYLLDESITPKGAVVIIAGGDHGRCTLPEGWDTCMQFHKLGYQCFLLQNRIHHNPWSKKEAGADTARAIRLIRKNEERYRINPKNIAIIGFSNGGITGDSCIAYYSGTQQVQDHFPEYVLDELDTYYGSPDAMICVYGPRFKNDPFEPGYTFSYENVIYPPTFIAVGRNDFAMENFPGYYSSLTEHNIPVEIHTFAGTPHGVAGMSLIDGYEKYKNFNLWIPLADAFMQDLYADRK